MPIYDIYSKRAQRAAGVDPDVYVYDKLPEPFRQQILMMWHDAFGYSPEDAGHSSHEIYFEIVKALRREYGMAVLFPNGYKNHAWAAYRELESFFLKTTSVPKLLDAVEISLRLVKNLAKSTFEKQKAADIIQEFNARAKEHGVGYQYSDGLLIRVDSEFVHREVVVPALSILRGTRFASAQEEFLNAHDHFRHGRCSEALVDCLKSFESTMKIICADRRWPYDESKGAKELIRACIDNGLIPTYWQNHFAGLRATLESGIPTPRNRQAGHGAGAQPVAPVPIFLASYVLNMTAATITFLAAADEELS